MALVHECSSECEVACLERVSARADPLGLCDDVAGSATKHGVINRRDVAETCRAKGSNQPGGVLALRATISVFACGE